MTEKQIKILYQYQISASVLMEQFTYAAPILREIEAIKYKTREQKRKALKQYDKDILNHKKWLLETSNLIEKTHEKEIDDIINKVSELFENINIIIK